MNVFDFDKTLYAGDSTLDFYLFCVRRHPGLVRALPRQLSGAARFALGKLTRDGFKAQFYSFLPLLRDPIAEVEAFWETHLSKMKPAVVQRAHEGDLVISASPEFLLKIPCEKNGWHLLASRVDARTGMVEGANCRGEEKVKRFEASFPNEKIASFYSDSLSDAPLAALAERSYLVKGNEVDEWPDR